jgi:hypothetical protein
MRGAIPPLSQYALLAWFSDKKEHRDNFTFTFTLTLRKAQDVSYLGNELSDRACEKDSRAVESCGL